MPIYEFACDSCGHEFEQLVRGGNSAQCPKCESRELQRKLSAFASVGSDSRAAEASPCARCGDPAGSCSNRAS